MCLFSSYVFAFYQPGKTDQDKIFTAKIKYDSTKILTIWFAQQTRMRKFDIFYANTYQYIPYGIQKDLNNGSELCCNKGACAIVKYTVPRHTCTYHKEEITRTLSYIYIDWYYLWIELSGWMGYVSYGLGADLSLPPCLSVTVGIWTLAHKSDPRAEISGEIVRYDALAPRPEVLLSWYFTCAWYIAWNLCSHHISYY